MNELIYKGFKIVANYYIEPKMYYSIFNSDGVEILNTLWNDDKMWRTADECFESAKKDIDNPTKSYMKNFRVIL